MQRISCVLSNALSFFSSGYDGPHTCITYDAVNQAYIQARKRIRKYILR